MEVSKLQKLEEWFGDKPGTITAFSGGVDSSLVLFLSKKFLPETTIGCISASASLKRKDYEEAVDFCIDFDIPLEVIETKEILDPSYNANPANRCFYCKNHLYTNIQQVQQKYPGYIVLNGTNTDDLGDYRPGIRAAREHRIGSPLAACGISKKDVRELARNMGLPNWDKPASPCLSSRIPYGMEVTLEKLRQIETAEEILNDFGLRDVRVRHFGTEARIEVPVREMALLKSNITEISGLIEKVGFDNCVVDEEGLVSGKLNRSINLQNGSTV